MTTHTLPMTRENLHGHFDNALPPALRIKPGDTVRYTLNPIATLSVRTN